MAFLHSSVLQEDFFQEIHDCGSDNPSKIYVYSLHLTNIRNYSSEEEVIL